MDFKVETLFSEFYFSFKLINFTIDIIKQPYIYLIYVAIILFIALKLRITRFPVKSLVFFKGYAVLLTMYLQKQLWMYIDVSSKFFDQNPVYIYIKFIEENTLAVSLLFSVSILQIILILLLAYRFYQEHTRIIYL